MLRTTLVIASGTAVLVATLAALLALGGYPVLPALASLWVGSLGSWYALTSGTLVRAIPLMLAGTGVALAFRAGVFNVGADGQFLVGAAAGVAVALAQPPGVMAVALALLMSAVAGALWAAIAAVLRRRFGVLEVISTIMLNFVALDLVSWLVRGPLQEPSHIYPQTATLPEASHLPYIPGAGRLHVGLVIAIAAAALVGWIVRHTAAGFRVTAVGLNARAAVSAGLVDAAQVRERALIASGALAGLAGGVEVCGVTFALYENISPGYGFTAIVVALLAALDAWLVIPSAILFAALEAGAGAMQRDAGIPATLVTTIEALLVLALVITQTLRFRIARPVPSSGAPT